MTEKAGSIVCVAMWAGSITCAGVGGGGGIRPWDWWPGGRVDRRRRFVVRDRNVTLELTPAVTHSSWHPIALQVLDSDCRGIGYLRVGGGKNKVMESDYT